MGSKRLTDEEVRQEIERLQGSKYVQMALRQQRERQRERQTLYTLRWLEKQGRRIEAEEQAAIDAEYEDYQRFEREEYKK